MIFTSTITTCVEWVLPKVTMVMLFAVSCIAGGITQESVRFVPTDGVAQQSYGGASAISGNTAVIGSPAGSVGGGSKWGSVYIYVFDSGAWTLQAQVSDNDGSVNDGFGGSVAIEGDTLVVGAPRAAGQVQNQGAVYIFNRNNGVWTQTAKLTASSSCVSPTGCSFGNSVSINNGTIAVGASKQSIGTLINRGEVYIYTLVGQQWTLQQEITAADGFADQNFGGGVIVNGDRAFVSASWDKIGSNNNQGSVYFYLRTNGMWTFQSKVVSPNGTTNLFFGSVIAVSGDTLLATAPREKVGTNFNQGAAYIFRWTGSTWAFESKLTASDGAPNDAFGGGAAIDGDLAVVGARAKKSGSFVDLGGTYSFERVGSTWVEKNQLQASDGVSGDQFGAGIAIQGNRIIVGASTKTVGNLAAEGVAYFFIRSVSSPDLIPEDDSGVSNSDNITNIRSLTFSIGDVTPGATVEFLRGTTVISTGIAGSDSVTVSDPLAPDNATTKYSARQTINGETTSPSVLFVTVRTVGPVPTVSQAPGQQDPTQNQPVSFRVTFDEAFTGSLTPAAISLAGSAANVSAAVITTTLQSGVGTIQVSGVSSDGAIVASVLPNVFQDAAGNLSVGSVAADNSVTIDTTGPSVTVNQAATQSDPGSGSVNFTVVFNEAVADGLNTSQISFAGSTISSSVLAVNQITGNGVVFNVNVEIHAETTGTVVVSIPAGKVHDLAGNVNLASTSIDNVITIDTLPLTVTVNQASGQSDPSFTTPINFTAQFSKPVVAFGASALSFAGSTVDTSKLHATITGSGTTYNIAVTNIGPDGGSLRLSILSHTVLDIAGNPNSASTSTDSSVLYVHGIMDRSFELTTSAGINTYWASTSTTFGTSLCTLSVCGSGAGTAGPRSGNAWIWFDGAGDNVAEEGSALQIVTFPSGGSAILSYYLRIGLASAPFSSLLQVKIDGNIVQKVTEASNSESVYTQRTVDVSAFADGGQHTLRFEYSRPAGGASDNFSLDDVSLIMPSPQSISKAKFDFDGDGKSDVSVFRPSNNTWYLNRSQVGFAAFQFGAAGDVLTPADFTGDGKTDIAVFRPSVGTWFVMRSEDNTFFGAQFGSNGDIPAPADFDGDGKADVAVYRPSQGTWYLLQSTAGFSAVQFGTAEDKPAVGDFDGDGKADISVYRPSSGVWYRLNSSNGSFAAAQFGAAGDKIVPADYTGDGKTDIAVWRPSNGVWYILRNEDSSFYVAGFGLNGDLPAPGDYDGDGKADVAVYRPSQGLWYMQQSTSGFNVVQFGTAEDKPAPGAFVY